MENTNNTDSRIIFITLNSVRAVTRFVNINQKTNCETLINIDKNNVISAKSIMSIFSINLLKPLKETITGNNSDISKLLDQYDDAQLSFDIC